MLAHTSLGEAGKACPCRRHSPCGLCPDFPTFVTRPHTLASHRRQLGVQRCGHCSRQAPLGLRGRCREGGHKGIPGGLASRHNRLRGSWQGRRHQCCRQNFTLLLQTAAAMKAGCHRRGCGGADEQEDHQCAGGRPGCHPLGAAKSAKVPHGPVAPHGRLVVARACQGCPDRVPRQRCQRVPARLQACCARRSATLGLGAGLELCETLIGRVLGPGKGTAHPAGTTPCCAAHTAPFAASPATLLPTLPCSFASQSHQAPWTFRRSS